MPRRDGHKAFDARTPAELRERRRKMREAELVSVWQGRKWHRFEQFIDRVNGEDEEGNRVFHT